MGLFSLVFLGISMRIFIYTTITQGVIPYFILTILSENYILWIDKFEAKVLNHIDKNSIKYVKNLTLDLRIYSEELQTL